MSPAPRSSSIPPRRAGSGILDRLESALDERPALLLLPLSIFYFLLTGYIAGRYRFFYDELFTFHIARLGSVTGIIDALGSAADIHPPLDYLVRAASLSLFGPGEFAERLPSVLAFWVFSASLYLLVRRRCSPLFALIAFVAPSVTYAYEFSFWGRSYALLLAASGVSLVAWQALTMNRHRLFNAILLWLGLSFCVAIHYYGLFACIPLLIGEAWRAAERGRIDRPAAIAVLGSLLMLGVHLPFAGIQLEQSGVFWSVPTLYHTTLAYWWLLKESVFVVPLFLLIFSLVMLLNLDRDSAPTTVRPVIPRWEIASAVSLLVLPFVCYLIAKGVTNAFHYRHTLLAITGVILLGIYALQYRSQPGRGMRISLLIALVLGACYEYSKTLHEALGSEAGRMRRARIERLLPRSDLPIVCGSRTEFLESITYGSLRLSQRTYYLMNEEASLARTGNDNGQRAIANIAPLLPGNVVEYDRFLSAHRSFILLNSWPRDWLLPQLIDDGASITIIASNGDDMVMNVDLPPDVAGTTH